MPKNKVLTKPKVSFVEHRSPVDLSTNSSITSLLGEIDVPYVQPFVKGSTGSINRKCFTRTADVVAPAFHRVTEHFDFFMVPIHALWRYWENWKLNMNDMQDTNLVPYTPQGSLNPGPNLTLPTNVPSVAFTNMPEKLGYLSRAADGTLSGSEQNVRYSNDVLRFMDELGFSDRIGGNFIIGDTGNRVMNLFKLCAYQKVYYNFYRNQAYESNNPYAYNLDWVTSSQVSNGVLLPQSDDKHRLVLRELFKRRRVNYRNDYFHNVYPGLNYVSSEVTGLTGFSVPSTVASINSTFPQVAPDGVVRPVGGANVESTSSTTVFVARAFSIQNIRAAFALDKLMRAAAYAPKKVRDQYKAQFGVDGHDYDKDMDCQRIGSFQSDVRFQEVTNMAQSSSANLGDLGAKGLGGQDNEKPIKFYCEYDCIVICMHYFSLRAKYDSLGFEPWNTHLTRDSFYVKAFENLGLRPFLYDYLDGRKDSSFGSLVIAWTLPNFEYKIKPDMNYGAFKEQFPEFYSTGSNAVEENLSDSYLKAFVPHTQNILNVGSSVVTAEYFKIAPEDLDTLFAVTVPKDHRRSYFQFFTDYEISVPAVVPMSIHGQPTM